MRLPAAVSHAGTWAHHGGRCWEEDLGPSENHYRCNLTFSLNPEPKPGPPPGPGGVELFQSGGTCLVHLRTAPLAF